MSPIDDSKLGQDMLDLEYQITSAFSRERRARKVLTESGIACILADDGRPLAFNGRLILRIAPGTHQWRQAIWGERPP